MQYIFDGLDGILNRIKSSRNVLLLFDYDGTLTPIVDKPELATLSEESRKTIKSLAAKKQFTIGIISGRAIGDIKSKAGIDNIIYAGNHGLEIEGPGFAFIHPLTEEIKSNLKLINIVLNKTMGSIKGTIVEDKGMTLSVHYRMVEDTDEEAEVKNVFDRVIGLARKIGRVNTSRGKKVYEVRPPVNWHKGKAVELIMKDYEKEKHKPLLIYMGDDLTDEDAFQSVKEFNGISMFVGEQTSDSRADYYLKSMDEVYDFIDKLLILESRE
jgi:trehalose 6-phosphate phosphatase